MVALARKPLLSHAYLASEDRQREIPLDIPLMVKNQIKREKEVEMKERRERRM